MIVSVWKILVVVGDVVMSESVLVVFEVMKMEVFIKGFVFSFVSIGVDVGGKGC